MQTVAPEEEQAGAGIPADTGAGIPADTGAGIPADTGAGILADTGAGIPADTGAGKHAGTINRKIFFPRAPETYYITACTVHKRDL